jgi:hypothetical protein
VICRLTTTGDNANAGYYFTIMADGMFSVLLNQYHSFTPMPNGDWQSSSAVITGKAVNHLTATCAGTHLKFVVNGVIVWEGDDSTFSSGDIGLTVATFEYNVPTEAHFTNFVASIP